MQLGMPTLIENRTLEENAVLCSSLGLRFLELNMNFPEYGLYRLEQTDELLRIADRSGIYYTVHLEEDLNIADFNPLVSGAYLETVRRTVDAAKKLICLCDRHGGGSRPLILNMHMNHGIHITLPDRKVQMYERDFDKYMDSFARFRTLSEEWIGDSGMMIAIENTDGFREYEKHAIEYLLGQGADSLVIDVRNNPGGLAAEAAVLLDYLLPAGRLFSEVDKKGPVSVTESDSMNLQMPTCVLLNSGTYGEAELFAAVLKEWNWATLMGEPTYGNTRSQETLPLSDGSAIRLSTRSYLTPSGVDICATGGVVPDFIVYNSDESATGTTEGTTGGEDGTASISDDDQLMAALRLLS